MSGPNPGTGCAVCEHDDAPQINALLSLPSASRPSNRKIALQFGISKDSVGRHVWKRHPGYRLPPEAQDAEPPLEDEASELDRLRRQRSQLEAEMDRRPSPDVSRELRQVNQRVSELEGRDRPAEYGMRDVRGLPEQVGRWFRALEPFPEAREAMLRATDPELLEAAGVSG